MLQRQQKSKRTDTLFPYTTLSRSGRWPTCQNMNLADGAEDTWSVTYVKGYAVPKGGQVAAGMLAVELAKAACNDKTCGLPRRVQSVTRQGVTVAVLDAFDDIDEGQIGRASCRERECTYV